VQAEIENKQLIITGDLNCNLLEQERSACTTKLLDIFYIYLLKQLIQSPTRVTARSSGVTGGCPGVQRRGAPTPGGPPAKFTIKFVLVHWANWPEPQL
jgi:hypothetical protein